MCQSSIILWVFNCCEWPQVIHSSTIHEPEFFSPQSNVNIAWLLLLFIHHAEQCVFFLQIFHISAYAQASIEII